MQFSADLKQFSDGELTFPANEFWTKTIKAVSETVGHQSYPYKILSGRRDKMCSLRQKDGLSGFTNCSDPSFDSFGTAHSFTSISVALGFAVARPLGGASQIGHGDAIAVIDDFAMSVDMVY